MDPTLISVVGAVVGFIAAVVVSVIGFFIKRTLGEYDDHRTRLEKKIDEYFAQARQDISDAEQTALEIRGEVHKDLLKMHDKFVPRTEITEIVRGIREASEKNSVTVTALHEKMDRLIIIMAEKK